jgi:hypothetical protein
MRRTELMQEIRAMRFGEAYEGWTESRLTQEEAARLLGVCSRSFRRYINRYEEAGLEGLLDKRITQVSLRRAPVDEVMALVERYKGAAPGLECEAFLWMVQERRRSKELYLGKEHPAITGIGSQGGQTWCSP